MGGSVPEGADLAGTGEALRGGGPGKNGRGGGGKGGCGGEGEESEEGEGCLYGVNHLGCCWSCCWIKIGKCHRRVYRDGVTGKGSLEIYRPGRDLGKGKGSRW